MFRPFHRLVSIVSTAAGRRRVAHFGAAIALVAPTVGGVVLGSAVHAPAAAASTPPPYQSSQTFRFQLTDQAFTVPPAVTQVFIDVVGGQGGGGAGGTAVSGGVGGLGADVGVLVGVTPGQVFEVHAGAAGSAGSSQDNAPGAGGRTNDNGAGGRGGTGNGLVDSSGGGGGGAASSVKTNGTLLAVAGGGGGGAGGGGISGYAGGAGGTAGTALTGGTGGTGPGAGSGGGTRNCLLWVGSAGGDAAQFTLAGGGGGGGGGYQVTWCGGEGGSAGGAGAGGGGGGGAGGSYANTDVVAAARIATATTTGGGSVTFSWTQPVPRIGVTVNGGATVGDAAVAIASVSPPAGVTGAPTPTGTVDFYRDAALVGSADLVNGSAAASFGVIAGDHTVRAAYRGDNIYAPAARLTFLSTAKASPQISGGTNPSPAVTVSDTDLTATVAPPSGADGLAPAPTGTVQFYYEDQGLVIADGTATLDGSNPPRAAVRGSLNAGRHTYVATYSGDDNYASATTRFSVDVGIPRASTVTLASSSNPSTFGDTVTFTAKVSTAAAPTGTVTFSDGSNTLGSVAVAADGTAQLATATLSAGAHSIYAWYDGDFAFDSSTSTALAQTVKATPAPTAAAGSDQSVASRGIVSVDGSSSTDPSHLPLTYAWQQISGPAAVIEDRTAARTRVTAPTGPATVKLRLTVTNGSGASAWDDILLTVRAPK